MKRLAALLGTLLLAACGGAPSRAPAMQATATEEPEPTTIDEAEAQVQRATARIDSATKAAPGGDSTATTGSSAYSAAEPEECRALHSLERAATALCRLAGRDDARCKNATQALERSRARVHCP